jgi:hypothetical protein
MAGARTLGGAGQTPITFDEEGRLRVLDVAKYEQTERLESECRSFVVRTRGVEGGRAGAGGGWGRKGGRSVGPRMRGARRGSWRVQASSSLLKLCHLSLR